MTRLNGQKMGVSVFIGMIALLSFHTSLLASNNNIGTSGAQFLKIGAGARPTAMGDAFVGIADDINSVYFNPAGLGTVKNSELTAMHTQWFQDMNYDFGAFALPLAKGTLALSAVTLQAQDIEKRDANEVTQGTFETLDSAYSLSYGLEMGGKLSLGITGRYIKQKIDTESASAWSGDVGLFKRFNNPLSVGFAIRHLGSKIKFQDEADPLPLTYDLGIGGHFLNENLILGMDIKKSRDNDVQFGMGGEIQRKIRNDFRYALRGGYNSGLTDADGSGVTIGAGLGFHKFDLDFAWVPMGDLGQTFRYAVLFRF